MAQESFLSAARKSRADFLIMHADLAVLPRVTPDEFNEQENAPPSLAPSVRFRANELQSMRKYRSVGYPAHAFTHFSSARKKLFFNIFQNSPAASS